MESNKTDRRVRKTKKQLRQGLTKLMEEKSVKDITVRELSDLVDINRGTFYLHYKDVFDMVEQIESELFETFHQVVDSNPVSSLNPDPLPMIIDVFHFIKENEDMTRVLLSKNGDIAFVNRLKDLVKGRCLHAWMEIFDTGKSQNFEYFYSFIVSGCIGLIQSWLEKGMPESPEHMAKLAQKMIQTGIQVIQ